MRVEEASCWGHIASESCRQELRREDRCRRRGGARENCHYHRPQSTQVNFGDLKQNEVIGIIIIMQKIRSTRVDGALGGDCCPVVCTGCVCVCVVLSLSFRIGGSTELPQAPRFSAFLLYAPGWTVMFILLHRARKDALISHGDVHCIALNRLIAIAVTPCCRIRCRVSGCN